MKIIESDLSNQILKSSQKKLGNIFFFSHFAVIEFNEGVHIGINNTSEIFEELIGYFGVSKPFGVITNRINSYSVNLLDAELFRQRVKNLCAYAVVAYNAASQMNAEIESTFCMSPNINYNNIQEAVESVYNKVKKKLIYPQTR